MKLTREERQQHAAGFRVGYNQTPLKVTAWDDEEAYILGFERGRAALSKNFVTIFERYGVDYPKLSEEDKDHRLLNECQLRDADGTCLDCLTTYASEYNHLQAKYNAARRRISYIQGEHCCNCNCGDCNDHICI